MKFVLLESRGGNYLVVAENIAWLRTGENGQTNVGMVGGSPLLVTGSIEEVATKVLAATKQDDQPDAAAPIPALPPAAIPNMPVTAQEPDTSAAPQTPVPERSQAGHGPRSTLADRVALAATPAVKAGTQRLMTISD
jgi:periplasmic protein TonB